MTRNSDLDRRFDAIFDRHHGDVARFCMRRLGRFDGEDAAAEVFAVAWRRLDEVPEGDRTRAWLLGVAYKVVGNQYRSRARRSRLRERLGGMGERRTAAEPEVLDGTAGVLAALDSLRVVDRELLQMVAWDGLTRNEIAQVLGIRENAVDQRLFRARTRLKARLDRPVGAKNSKEAQA